MPSSALTTRFRTFRINPIFRRYCYSRLRPKGLGTALLLSGLAAGFLFSMMRAIAFHRVDVAVVDAERAPLIPLLVLQGVILFVLGTGQVAGGMTAEADEGVLDYQRLAPMSPLSKVLGYLFGLPVREYAMFGITLPFTAWSLWRGEVPAAVWVPLYAAVFTSTVLYHLTGLVAGTVLRNRRWAFLVSIGMVFLLYTVIPQLAKFGLVFFKYFTINPVVVECLSRLIPESGGAMMAVAQRLQPAPRPFGLDLPEVVFTVFSQGGLIVTFLVMLCRRWRRAESHLMGKAWAVGLFVWIQVLLLGNALPQIASGALFPSRGLRMVIARGEEYEWSPNLVEAVIMSAIYGVVSLALLFLLTAFITPSRETQIRGWRRARKLGISSIPAFSDAAGAFRFVFAMAVTAAAGWFLFTREIMGSRWFPEQSVPLGTPGSFLVTLVTAAHAFHAALEARGGRYVALAAIFAGAVPVMIAAVLAATGNDQFEIALFFAAISPPTHPLYAVLSTIPVDDFSTEAVPVSWIFWQVVWAVIAIRLVRRLRRERQAIAALVEGTPPGTASAVEEPGQPAVASPSAG